MDREQAKDYIRARATTEYLQPDRSGKGYICPICGSGSGAKGTGITTKDGGEHFTCWKGCFTSADILDIIGLEHGVAEYRDKLRKAAEIFGISIDGAADPSQIQRRTERTTQPKQAKQPNVEQEPEDLTSFFLQAAEHIEETDYHRGISLETLKRFKVGFIPEWKHPNASENVSTSPRLIIPISRNTYLARDTRQTVPEWERDYTKGKVKAGKAESWTFNRKAIVTATEPVFIVEGEIDALSIADVGGTAVSLGSIYNASKFLQELEQELEKVDRETPLQPFIISLDNDPEPDTKAIVKKAADKLKNGFESMGIPYTEKDIVGAYKDPNEALTHNRKAFKEAVEQAVEETIDEVANKEAKELRTEAVSYSLQSFIQHISDSRTAHFYPTGFKKLDKLLDGGIYAGLYIIGAISSLGKTTFCLQVADNIAAAGHDVIIYSLEMSRDELIAKSVSRLTFMADLEQNRTTQNAKTARGILTGSRYQSYNSTEKRLIQEAITHYGEYAGNIFIVEGCGNIGTKEIAERVERHKRLTGKAPVVLIDYLQILTPPDMRATDKQNTDKNVSDLRRISKDYSAPVIAISSFNRESYTDPVSLSSFKESGAIEYSADLLLGLQYSGMDYETTGDGKPESKNTREVRVRKLLDEVTEKSRKGEAIPVQVKILKNRNGSKGSSELLFYSMFNYFKEPETESGDNDGWEKIVGTKYKTRK